MSLLSPFAYPTMPHVRCHGPRGYADYQLYKPFLRDEFTFRCVYCLERETWYPDRAASFSADHFVAKVIDPDRECDYENLVYACTRCNSLKGKKRLPLDPISSALANHVRVLEDGRIEGITAEGRKLVTILDLAYPPALEVREETLLILRAKREHPDDATIDQIFLRRFRFPTDLPDLRRPLPPEGNSRLGGIADSHYARKERRELPEVY